MQIVEGIPEYLYHYTSLKSAKLILMNKTLRLTSLECMDDTTEAITGEGRNLGKFIFSSCWSENRDSIPQWSMYGDSSRGVCIKLRSFPFKNNYDDYVEHCINKEDQPSEKSTDETFIVPAQYSFQNRFILIPQFIISDKDRDLLTQRLNAKVTYTDDESLIYPKCLRQDGEFFCFDTNVLGKYKSTEWKFQKEWRYSVIYIPFDQIKFFSDKKYSANVGQEVFNNLLSNNQPIVHYLDFNIDDKYFDDMELICGPMMEEFDYQELTYFAKGVNPNIRVVRSKLYNKWKSKI